MGDLSELKVLGGVGGVRLCVPAVGGRTEAVQVRGLCGHDCVGKRGPLVARVARAQLGKWNVAAFPAGLAGLVARVASA